MWLKWNIKRTYGKEYHRLGFLWTVLLCFWSRLPVLLLMIHFLTFELVWDYRWKKKNNNTILVVIKTKPIWPSTKMMQSLWQLQLNLCLTLWSSFLRRCLPSRLCSGSWSQRKVTQRKCCWRRSSAPCRRGFDNVAIRKFPSRKWWGPEGRKDKTKKLIYLASSS